MTDFWNVTFDRDIKVKQYIIVRDDLWMSRWKLVAQGCHAAVEVYKLMLSKNTYKWTLDEWEKNDERHVTKICLKVNSEKEICDLHQYCEENGIPSILIRDNGVTEIEPNTITALWIWPWYIEKLDFLKSLKLLK